MNGKNGFRSAIFTVWKTLPPGEQTNRTMETGENTPQKAEPQIGAWTPFRHGVLPHALDRHPVRQYRLVDAGCRSRMADGSSLAPTRNRSWYPSYRPPPAPRFSCWPSRQAPLADIVDRRRYLIGTQIWMAACAGSLRDSDTDRRHRFPAVVAVHLLSGRRHRHDDAGLGRHHSGTRPP